MKSFIHRVHDRIKREQQERLKNQRERDWENLTKENGTLLKKIGAGSQLRLYRDSEVSRLIFCDDFELAERNYLQTLLRPNDIFIDVGANIGLYTISASMIVGNTGHVIAFEPSSETHKRLISNIELNACENVRAEYMALSNEETTLELKLFANGYDGWNTFGPSAIEDQFSTQLVDTITWDKYAEEHQLVGKVRMMKIDVEGWESQVLEGARNTLLRSDAPILQLEVSENYSHLNHTTPQAIGNFLVNVGYMIFYLDSQTKKLVRVRENEVRDGNYYALKDIEDISISVR